MSWFYRRYHGTKHVLYDEYDDLGRAVEDLASARSEGVDGHIAHRRRGPMWYALYLQNE